MSTIVSAGVASGLTNLIEGGLLKVDPSLKKYVTYINDTGAVHTIIVDVEHAAQSGEELLDWFEHTKAAVQSGQFDGQPAQAVTDHATATQAAGHPFPSTTPTAPQYQGGVG